MNSSRRALLSAVLGAGAAMCAVAVPVAATSVPSGTTPAVSPVPARPSAGCASASATSAEGSADRTVPITVGYLGGRYLVHTPPTATGPLPVVISLHGYSSTLEMQVKLTEIDQFADTAGFMTVTPQIDRKVPRWDVSAGSPDVLFVGGVIDELAATSCIDLARIYAAGMSNGAMMTSRLACEMSDRIAAFAMVTGVLDPAQCDPRRPAPLLAIHGTDDPLVAFGGGLGPGAAKLPSADGSSTLGTVPIDALPPDLRASVPDRVSGWAARSQCAAEVAGAAVADDVIEFDYDCPAGVDVQLWQVENGGHTWPGSQFLVGLEDFVGTTTMSIEANEVIWTFFQRFAIDQP